MLFFLKTLFAQNHQRWGCRVRLFHRAHQLWNCLAWHVVVDHHDKTMRWTFAIPGIITWFTQTPLIPDALGAVALCGGEGERAEYGFWHDYHETKLQWRRIINRDDSRSGWEWRTIHVHFKPRVVRHETMLSNRVEEVGNQWATTHHFDRWGFFLTTWRAQSAHWFIPSLYDHFFTLTGTGVDGVVHDTTLRLATGVKDCIHCAFEVLAKEFEATESKLAEKAKS